MRVSVLKERYEGSSVEACVTGVMAINPLNLIKMVMNIHIWVKLYKFGRKYTHSGVNNSEMCSLEA